MRLTVLLALYYFPICKCQHCLTSCDSFSRFPSACDPEVGLHYYMMIRYF